MKPKEQARLQVLNSLLAEHMTLDQTAALMGVSPRHTRRILADYRKNGAASLAHGHRGRGPADAISETTRSRVVHLARTVYEGANHTHLSELLSEREGLDIGRTTLRRILVNAGLSIPSRGIRWLTNLGIDRYDMRDNNPPDNSNMSHRGLENIVGDVPSARASRHYLRNKNH